MSKSGFDCGGCERSNTVDDMVLCDGCGKWYHYGCAGVTAEINFREWRCDSCVRDVAKSAVKGKGQCKTSKEAIVNVKKPTESCKGDEKAKQAASSEGESSQHKPSAGIPVATTSQNATRPPSKRMSTRSSWKTTSQAAFERLAKVHELEREMAAKEFELKMASLKLKQDKLRFKLEDEYERGSHRSSISSTSKTEQWVRDQQNQFDAISETSEPTRMEPVAVNPTPIIPVAMTERSGLTEDQEWLVFISFYNDSTEACGYTDRENIIRLEECLQGPAREAVLSKLNTPKAAPLVIKTLQRLYGRPALVVKELLSQARRTEAPKAEHLESLITYGMALCDQLVMADMEDHLNNPMLLEELAEKLPASRSLEWIRYKGRIAHGRAAPTQ
uniref:PHD-type domain-containing protein n=1 Tax=Anopheles epiroticus TaxID=199890 RepID=A0A182PX56_9DIPT